MKYSTRKANPIKMLTASEVEIPELDPSLQTKKKASTIRNERSDKPTTKKDQHYVDNEQFFLALIDWFNECETCIQAGLKEPKIPEYIGECILRICQRLSMLRSFNRYSYRDDMVSSAIETCVTKLKKFNPRKTRNPLAYFTQCAYFAFINMITEENKRKYRRYKMTLSAISEGLTATMPEQTSEMEDHILENTGIRTNLLEDYIKDYEIKQQKRKDAAKQAEVTVLSEKEDV